MLFATLICGCALHRSPTATGKRQCLPLNYLAASDTTVEDLLDDKCANEKSVRPMQVTPAAYPEEMRLRCREGNVTLKFVVDTLGVPDLKSVRTVRGDNVLFVAASRDALRHARYEPATVNGKKVRQWAAQPFRFRLYPTHVAGSCKPGG